MSAGWTRLCCWNWGMSPPPHLRCVNNLQTCRDSGGARIRTPTPQKCRPCYFLTIWTLKRWQQNIFSRLPEFLHFCHISAFICFSRSLSSFGGMDSKFQCGRMRDVYNMYLLFWWTCSLSPELAKFNVSLVNDFACVFLLLQTKDKTLTCM